MNIKGPTKSWADVGSSGKPVHRIWCSECGSQIAHDPEAAPDIIAIKAGTLTKELKQTLKPVCILLSCLEGSCVSKQVTWFVTDSVAYLGY